MSILALESSWKTISSISGPIFAQVFEETVQMKDMLRRCIAAIGTPVLPLAAWIHQRFPDGVAAWVRCMAGEESMVDIPLSAQRRNPLVADVLD